MKLSSIEYRVRKAVVNGVASRSFCPRLLRVWLLRRLGAVVLTTAIAPGCYFGRQVTLGSGVYVNRGCFFDASAPITVGPGTHLGMEVLIATSSHEIGDPKRRAGRVTSAPVTVGSGCWVGARAVLLPGVTLGDGTIVAAGAVVASDCLTPGIYGGVPAKLIRPLQDA